MVEAFIHCETSRRTEAALGRRGRVAAAACAARVERRHGQAQSPHSSPEHLSRWCRRMPESSCSQARARAMLDKWSTSSMDGTASALRCAWHTPQLPSYGDMCLRDERAHRGVPKRMRLLPSPVWTGRWTSLATAGHRKLPRPGDAGWSPVRHTRLHAAGLSRRRVQHRTVYRTTPPGTNATKGEAALAAAPAKVFPMGFT